MTTQQPFFVLYLPMGEQGAGLRQIPPDLNSRADLDVMHALSALVGGDIEAVEITGYANAYVDDLGLVKGIGPNVVLNALLAKLDAPIAAEQWVAGNAVVYGALDAAGYEQDVDPRVVSLVRRMGLPVSGLELDKKYNNC